MQAEYFNFEIELTMCFWEGEGPVQIDKVILCLSSIELLDDCIAGLNEIVERISHLLLHAILFCSDLLL